MVENFGTFGFKDLFSLCVNLILAFAFFFSPCNTACENMFSVSSLTRLRFILSRFKTRLAVIGFQDVGRCLFVSDDVSGNQLLHYFVGTTIDWLNSGIHVSFCNWVLPHVSPTSVELHTVISHTVL